MLPLGNLTAAGRTADRCNFGTTCLSTRHNVIRIFFRGAPPSPSTGGGRGSHLARHGPGSIHPPPLSRKGGVRGSGWSGGSGLRRERHSCGTVGRDLPMSLGVATGQRTPNPLPVRSLRLVERWVRSVEGTSFERRLAYHAYGPSERVVLARCLGTLVSPVCRSVPGVQWTAHPLLGGRNASRRVRTGCDPAPFPTSGQITVPSSATRQRHWCAELSACTGNG